MHIIQAYIVLSMLISFVMYDYNSDIELKIENDLSRKKMSSVKEKIEKLHKFKQTLSQR